MTLYAYRTPRTASWGTAREQSFEVAVVVEQMPRALSLRFDNGHLTHDRTSDFRVLVEPEDFPTILAAMARVDRAALAQAVLCGLPAQDRDLYDDPEDE